MSTADASPQRRTRWRLVLLAMAVVTSIALAFAMLARDGDGAEWLTGRVVGPAGEAVRGAAVTTATATTKTDEKGRFTVESGVGWVTVSGDSWLPRTRAARPGEEVLVRLAPDETGTVSFAFGGDVMFGRRYFDPDEDGDVDGLLEPGSGPEDHAALLDGIAPLLDDADLTVVNLESPFAAQPHFDPTRPRPEGWHPTKEFAFASSPLAAEALNTVGIDVVDLGNNHLYDRLEGGIENTLDGLATAGFTAGHGVFGAGGSQDEAWTPARRDVEGQQVAFFGCTTITGEEHELTYVASTAKGGAAACEPQRLTAEVRAATTWADIVVVMIHGGFEYGRDPSTNIRALSDLAVDAGATLVINHHPHVVGGLRYASGKLTAWTLGNLLFDQTVWPTFDSYLLLVAVRDGIVVSAWIEPVRLQGFVPVGVTAEDAAWVVEGALARSEGPWVLDDGSLWLDLAGAATEARVSVHGQTTGRTGRRTLAEVGSGCATGGGRDLLWTGGFEDRDLASNVTVPLWNVDDRNRDRKVTGKAARNGDRGVRLRRSGGDRDPNLLTPLHRVLVNADTDLTFLLQYRNVLAPGHAEVWLSWYNDTKGPSQQRTVVPLPEGGGWRPLRIDVKVPAHAVAVQPFIVLTPPGPRLTILDVDDVKLIAWDEPGCTYLRGDGQVTGRALPPLTPEIRINPLNVQPTPITRPEPLPPGPEAKPD